MYWPLCTGDSRIAGSDLKRTEACYASAAAIEKMTNDFSALFAHTSRPSTAQLHNIELNYPTELTNEGYTFPDHTIALNSAALAAMGTNPTVTIPYGPFGGLIANLKPYTLTTTAQSSMAQCKLTRDMNNYLIPLFQFGMFSDEDIELHPGPAFTFNGRVHANGNIYVNGNVKFLAKVTTANEFIYDVLRNGSTRTGATVSMQVGSINVALTKGSMNNGPNLPTATASPAGQQGYFPASPNGTINTSWKSTSVAAATTGTANQFGGQLLTRTTGAAPLKLPLQLDNNPTRELIKRRMPNDSPGSTTPSALSDSRYHSKATIRILIDDEAPSTTDASGLNAQPLNGDGTTNAGQLLSQFDPIPLPNAVTNSSVTANGGGRALWRVTDTNTSASNSYTNETTTSYVQQFQQTGINTTLGRQADTVRRVFGHLTDLRNIPGLPAAGLFTCARAFASAVCRTLCQFSMPIAFKEWGCSLCAPSPRASSSSPCARAGSASPTSTSSSRTTASSSTRPSITSGSTWSASPTGPSCAARSRRACGPTASPPCTPGPPTVASGSPTASASAPGPRWPATTR